jgi:hypothetical protein
MVSRSKGLDLAMPSSFADVALWGPCFEEARNLEAFICPRIYEANGLILNCCSCNDRAPRLVLGAATSRSWSSLRRALCYAHVPWLEKSRQWVTRAKTHLLRTGCRPQDTASIDDGTANAETSATLSWQKRL